MGMGGAQNQADELAWGKGVCTVFRSTGNFVKAIWSRWTRPYRFEFSVSKLCVVCHLRHLLRNRSVLDLIVFVLSSGNGTISS